MSRKLCALISTAYNRPTKNSHHPCRKPWALPSRNAAPRWRRTSSSAWGSRALRPATKTKQNKTNQTTQLSVATLARNARARAAIGVRAPSTLSCLCSLAAWSKLFDISDMPKSCAEGPGATVRDESRSIKEPEEIGGGRGEARVEGRKAVKGGDPWIDPPPVWREQEGGRARSPRGA